MRYTPTELELISTATDLVDQRDLETQATAFINEFPKRLQKAKDYFSSYLQYQSLLTEYYQLNSKERQNKEPYFKAQLTILEKNMKKNFKLSKNDPEAQLKKYLHAHYNLKCQLDNNRHLSVKQGGGQEEDNAIESEMQKLAETGFSSAEVLRAESLTSTRETQEDAYKKGAALGNLQCKIKLADLYLNARVQGQSTERLGLTEAQAIAFIKEGIEKKSPIAIASLSTFLDNTTKSLPFLYSDKSSKKDLIDIARNGQLALSICPEPHIHKNIQALLAMGPHGANKSYLDASKKLRDNILGDIPKLALSLKLPKEQAVHMAKELAAESTFTHLITSLNNKITHQIDIYHTKSNSAKAADKTTLHAKITALKKAHADLQQLKSAPSTLEVKLTKAEAIVARLDKDTQDLPSSNRLKKFINHVIEKMYQTKNHFKSNARNLAQEGKQMLFEFQLKTHNSPNTHKPENPQIQSKPSLNRRPPSQ